MAFSTLPTEIVKSILKRNQQIDDWKNASLVCSRWNQISGNLAETLRNINVRFGTGNREPTADEIFNEFLPIMVASERKYVNVEFCHMNFKLPIAKDLLKFIIVRCQDSIRCLKFTACEGLVRTGLLTILSITHGLEELHLHSRIGHDEGPMKQCELTSLRLVSIEDVVGIQVGESYQLHPELCWLAPNLKELSIYPKNEHLVVETIAHFSRQLTKLECRISDADFHQLEFTNLVELNFETDELIDETSISKLEHLKILSLRGGMTYEMMLAIGTLQDLESLSLHNTTPIHVNVCHLSNLNNLQNLKQLCLRGSSLVWTDAKLSMLRKLVVDQLGYDFSKFLNDSRIASLELYETSLMKTTLGEICRLASHLERLELIRCRYVTDEDLYNINRLPNLIEFKWSCLEGLSGRRHSAVALFAVEDRCSISEITIVSSVGKLCRRLYALVTGARIT